MVWPFLAHLHPRLLSVPYVSSIVHFFFFIEYLKTVTLMSVLSTTLIELRIVLQTLSFG
uniref:Uncharacterized protein n=1 Tax=Arundo donax TaxID=35708 RepID=A0A0A9HV34_ARUDO